ncbi:DUF5689 domain-containing protein [Haloflavibacter putidus]|uniref:DUF5017 domain-containing protein n=1 Tax=Haloflavibacter putidus TaxID=2576776 RepID=A0A507ZLX9_9FLAO|nr:DUF5689 domain-containing protein [Haloflavibacter putidus]TQD38490.1 DUF5017 domain-containing protein [Haloflavibacter putidus]
MKTVKNLKILSILFLGLFATSCVQDDDFDTPPINFDEPDKDVNFTIQAVKDLAEDSPVPVEIVAGEDSDLELYIEGYVISNDEPGNFYKTLIIQDAPENPTAGIAISTEASDLYTRFEPGRKIYFRVDGLYSGDYANLPTIGTQDGDQVGRISVTEFEDRIARSGTKEELVPTVISIDQIGDEYLNTLVKFENVQFVESLIGESYGNTNDTFNVNRTVENCDGETVIMRNSGYSNFKNMLLPTKNGELTAVMSLFGSTYQLTIRGPEDVNFTEPRCGAIFKQNFEGDDVNPGTDIQIEGWTNLNANGGSRVWQTREFSGNSYAQTSAFGSGEDPYEAWLITPAVSLADLSEATFNFTSNDGYYNGDALTVLVSSDFNGDVDAATWTDVTAQATIASGDENGYGSFIPSGDIDISSFVGQDVYIAFKYLGSANGVSTTYQIDNIRVLGQ